MRIGIPWRGRSVIRGKRLDAHARGEAKPPAAGDGSEQQPRLHQRERLPDAAANAAPEREVAEGRTSSFGLRRPALRVEAQRLLEEAGVPVRDPRAQQDDRAGGDDVAAELDVGQRPAPDQPRGRIEPHRLLQHAARVLEPREIGHRRRTTVELLVELAVQAAFDLGVAGEQHPGPGQRHRGRLVPGEEDRHRLVVDLLVGHGSAVLVASVEQEREQVAATWTGTAFGDQPVDRRVEAAARCMQPANGRQREVLERTVEGEHEALERLHRVAECGADLGGLGPDLAREERPRDHVERQARHLLVHVAGLAVSPPEQQAFRALDHRVAVLDDAAPVEERLHQSPLLQVKRPLAGQQSLAEDPLRLLEGLALHKRPLVRDEHLLDKLGMVQQVLVARPPPESRHVAVLRGHPRE